MDTGVPAAGVTADAVSGTADAFGHALAVRDHAEVVAGTRTHPVST